MSSRAALWWWMRSLEGVEEEEDGDEELNERDAKQRRVTDASAESIARGRARVVGGGEVDLARGLKSVLPQKEIARLPSAHPKLSSPRRRARTQKSTPGPPTGRVCCASFCRSFFTIFCKSTMR